MIYNLAIEYSYKDFWYVFSSCPLCNKKWSSDEHYYAGAEIRWQNCGKCSFSVRLKIIGKSNTGKAAFFFTIADKKLCVEINESGTFMTSAFRPKKQILAHKGEGIDLEVIKKDFVDKYSLLK